MLGMQPWRVLINKPHSILGYNHSQIKAQRNRWHTVSAILYFSKDQWATECIKLDSIDIHDINIMIS